jgi:hypothetical protein
MKSVKEETKESRTSQENPEMVASDHQGVVSEKPDVRVEYSSGDAFIIQSKK